MKDRLVILTLSYGMGDVIAARAVADTWHAQIDDDVMVIDGIQWFPAWFKLLYVTPYWLMIRYCPALWRKLFEGRLRDIKRHTISPALMALGTQRLLDHLEGLRPRAILAAEVGACEIASLYKTRRDDRVQIAAMILNYGCEPAWVQPGVDMYCVPSDGIAAQLREWGAGHTPIEIVGVPIARSFLNGESKTSARERCGLSPNRPTILLMAGGMGPARLDAVTTELDRAGDMPVQAIAIAGHDRALLDRLRKLRPTRTDVHAIGWTDNVSSYMAAADVLITKPGALTLSEASAMHLPVIAFDALPGLEEENAREWIRRGAGWLSRSPAEAASLALAVLRGDLHASSAGPGRPAAEAIVRLLLSLDSFAPQRRTAEVARPVRRPSPSPAQYRSTFSEGNLPDG